MSATAPDFRCLYIANKFVRVAEAATDVLLRSALGLRDHVLGLLSAAAMSGDLTAETDAAARLLDRRHRAAQPDTVGAKAANLCGGERGFAHPAGFVIGTRSPRHTRTANAHLSEEVVALVEKGVRHVEDATSRHFGGEPASVARRGPVRAARSMPGMLDTILNVGLCDVTVPGLLPRQAIPSLSGTPTGG